MKELAPAALHPCVMAQPLGHGLALCPVCPAPARTHLHLHVGWARGVGEEFVVGECCFPLFSELNFNIRVLLLKCRWGTSAAGLNTATAG